MLTVEIRVNGSIITAAAVVNIAATIDGPSRYLYQVSSFPLDHTKPPETWNGTFFHTRSDGDKELVRKLMALCQPKK